MEMGTWQLAICGLFLVIIVLSIAMIDLRRMIIPNALTLLLAATGLGFQIWSQPRFPLSVLLGALALAAVFYAVRALYLQRTGVVGLGLGDVKMAGASALWLHPANLPVFVFIACASALVSLGLFRRHDWRYRLSGRLPFGPFLGLALIASWCMENFTGYSLWAR